MKVRTFFLFLVLCLKIQWKDRIATSAFLIGITLQTFLLSYAIFINSENFLQAWVWSLRASFLNGFSILLLSSMSSLSNEMRYGTYENVLLSRLSLNVLVWLRAFSTSVISTPAFLIPFGIVVYKYGMASVSSDFLFSIFSVYIIIAVLGGVISFLLNCFTAPSIWIPWFKIILVLFGLNLFETQWSYFISLVFPTGWILKINHFGIFWTSIGLFSTLVFWCLLLLPWSISFSRKTLHLQWVKGKFS